MNMSNEIAGLILDMLGESGMAEIQRNELAQNLGCVPSQINYVISSRFTPEHGYIVESRRGGGGYVRITRVACDKSTALMHAVNAVGDEIDEPTVRAHVSNLSSSGIIDPLMASVMLSATGDRCLKDADPKTKDKIRASIFKYILLTLIKS